MEPFEPILKAFSFAARAHQGQFRKDGETPYVSHVMRVTLIVRHVFEQTDVDLLTAAALHDTIEDTTTDFDDLAEAFSPRVARWVALLSKDSRLEDSERERHYVESLRTADWQVQVCKLGDVVDNLLDSREGPKERRKKSRKRARSYLDALAGSASPEVQRAWAITDEIWRKGKEA